MTAPTVVAVRGVLFVRPPPAQQDFLGDRRRSWQRWMELAGRPYTETIRSTWEIVVFVARYACQDIDKVEHWPLSKLVRVATLTAELLEEEAKKSRIAPHNGGGW